MVDEQVRVREQKPVAGVRIDDQVGVRQELRHRERANRRHYHVVAAVRNQRRLLDLSRMVVRRIAYCSPWDRART